MHPRIGDLDGFASGAMGRSDRSSQLKHDGSACKSCDAMLILNQCRSREHGSVSSLIDGPRSRCECRDDDRHAVHRWLPQNLILLLKTREARTALQWRMHDMSSDTAPRNLECAIEDSRPFPAAARHQTLH